MPILSNSSNPAISRSKTLIGSEKSLAKSESDASKQWRILQDLANRQESSTWNIRCSTVISKKEFTNYAAENSSFGLSRSLSMRELTAVKKGRKSSPTITNEQLKEIKARVKTAIKEEKIFTIIGPYDRLRKVLRERGWVEKIYIPNPGSPSSNRPGLFPAHHFIGDDFESRSVFAIDSQESSHLPGSSRSTSENKPSVKHKSSIAESEPTSSRDDCGQHSGACPSTRALKVPPWEEENGFYAAMSSFLKTEDPNFIWTLKVRDIDYRFLKRTQLVNHHIKADSFTTKIGLCRNLRQLHWFENQSPDFFFPRCYILNNEDERISFIEDFRMTACFAVIKVVAKAATVTAGSENGGASQSEPLTSLTILKNYDETKINTGSITGSNSQKSNEIKETEEESPVDLTSAENSLENNDTTNKQSESKILPKIKYKSDPLPGVQVSIETVQFAIKQCELFLGRHEHTDIDKEDNMNSISESIWIDFLREYYKIINYGATIVNGGSMAPKCAKLYAKLKTMIPQFEMDGIRNVWIMKPGAKSRGRGISCYNNLTEMMTIVTSQAAKLDCFVVQKYIERPLLIYNTKFDIRQWILVTDWNPLTIWWYSDCYIRFCSQEFTLEDFNESVHLSNNAIQSKYCNGPRSTELPADNIWHIDQFKEYLDKIGEPLMWNQFIKPGMKDAVTSSLICAQDAVEMRKNSFELYGVDFMVSDDFRPWLIEINSSPCMAASTSVTSKLTSEVLEDIVKVVVDRRYDRIPKAGKFDLIFRQPTIAAPPNASINLSVSGQRIRNSSNNWDDSTRVGPLQRQTANNLLSSRFNANSQFNERQNHLKPKPSSQPIKSLSGSTSNLSKKMLGNSLPSQQQRGSRVIEVNERSPRQRAFSYSTNGVTRMNESSTRFHKLRNNDTTNTTGGQMRNRAQSLGPSKVSTSKQQSLTLPQIVSAN